MSGAASTDSAGTGISKINISSLATERRTAAFRGARSAGGTPRAQTGRSRSRDSVRARTGCASTTPATPTSASAGTTRRPSTRASTSPSPKGARVAGIDAVLSRESRIAGRLTDASGAAIPNHSVSVRQKSGATGMWNWVRNGQTDSAGNYDIGGLQAGTYRVCFEGYNTEFLSECWDDKATVELAKDVVVPTEGTRLGGVNAVLARGGRISGTVTNSDRRRHPEPVRQPPAEGGRRFDVAGHHQCADRRSGHVPVQRSQGRHLPRVLPGVPDAVPERVLE